VLAWEEEAASHVISTLEVNLSATTDQLTITEQQTGWQKNAQVTVQGFL